MNKKNQIIKLFNAGIDDEEIADKVDSSLKYVRQVLRDEKELFYQSSKENSFKSEIEYINQEIDDLRFRVEEQERIIHGMLNKEENAYNNVEDIIIGIEEVKSFIEKIKKNHEYIKNFKAKFTIEWDSSFNKKDENTMYDKPSFNPVAFYKKEGEKKLKDKLNYLSNEELIQMIEEYVPDLKGSAYMYKSRDKLVQYILGKVKGFV
ncbi:hypothetical protein I6U48_01070 [Clostridium sp. PL3]|uniref:Uncharacterized protein n=1 Tax=Clostridium thailandense TaxID=2794346 RepID=A0A949TUA1_9CLOT|nr:hypothetical protein [Clostridium thailandense]MBV7271510.1 hypothetical protein [Clostridium thailandense]